MDSFFEHKVSLKKIGNFSLAVFLLLLAFSSVASAGTPADAISYDRADTNEIRAQVKKIMSEPEFRVKKHFLQWLSEKLSAWEKPSLFSGPVWSKILNIIILPWCILTLIAILCHLIWSLWLVFRPSKESSWPKEVFASDSVVQSSFEQLLGLSQDFASRGVFRDAVIMLMAAMLKGLDSAGIVKFHESKTNGDFVREYPSETPGRNEFQKFVYLFEHMIYGGDVAEEPEYLKMNGLMEQIYAGLKA